ncbi:unnamed protein product [Arctia plantaginis]|uniref:Uncharacterized protein n=1 Tax=Arctia plantaginis TaxID=874455 RepID=A0A8S1AYM1_ARCPL|nr:unnamed protein product [Arctia plantaginis]
MKFLVVLFAVLAVTVDSSYVQKTVTYTHEEPTHVAPARESSVVSAGHVVAAAPVAAAAVAASPFVAAADAVHHAAHHGHNSGFPL